MSFLNQINSLVSRVFQISMCFLFLCNIATAQWSGQPCEREKAAYEEMRLRTMATKTSLELTRNYRAALDDSYESTRASGYADAVVDVASLAAGWPLGKAVEKAFLGEVKNTFNEKLIKAGFKSVEKALLKDPAVRTFFETQTADPTSLSGVSFDLSKEAFKQNFKEVFGDVGGESIIGVFDLAKFSYERYKGMNRLEAIRAQIRLVDDQIVSLQTRETEQMDILRSSRSAVTICQDRWAQNLPPDQDNSLWKQVVNYLGPQWGGPSAVVTKQEKIDERFVGSWTCPAKITLQFNLNGTGAWVDNRGGPDGSMYASGTFPGTWQSAGDTVTLYISRAEYGIRGGTVSFELRDGKLHDDWSNVYSKD